MSDDNKPATKADMIKVSNDISKLAIATKNTFDRIEAKMVTKNQFATLKKGQAGLKGDVATLKKGQAGLKGDVATLKKGQAGLKGDVATLKKGQAGLKQSQQAILGILDENNQLLKEIRRLPERVERLERSVFRR